MDISFYYINANEVPRELWRENFISSLWLHNKQNITCPLLDMNFMFSRVELSKMKFISKRVHEISYLRTF